MNQQSLMLFSVDSAMQKGRIDARDYLHKICVMCMSIVYNMWIMNALCANDGHSIALIQTDPGTQEDT